MNTWLYPLLSVTVISFISLAGALTLAINQDRLKKFLIYFVSFSAGALLGDVFIHLLPELAEENAFNLTSSLFILVGILCSFIIEKFICWHHCNLHESESHIHRFAYMNIIGDSVHNFVDGLVIGASFLVGIPVGIATTIAVAFHEIPQEIGDFGVLLHGGFTKAQALFYNFMTSLTAILGAVIALILSSYLENINTFLIPFAAGTFIYIASSDLIPELHKHGELKKGIMQTFFFIAGIGVMMGLLLLE